jgi:NAD dependent epimerase/dehydratase family enzyme
VTDDVPVMMRDYIEALRSAFGFRRPWALPRSFARLLLGSNAATLLRSQRVANARFKAATGWTPRFPSVREGWSAIAQEARSASAPNASTA